MTITATQRGFTREVNYDQYLVQQPEELDAKWVGISDGESIKEFLGVDAIQGVLEGVSTIVGALQLTLTTVDALVDLIVVVIGRTVVDATEALVLALKEVLQVFLNLFTGLSVNTLYHFPETYKTRRTPNEILYDVGMAYLDKKDSKRPLMVDDVFAGILVATFSFPNLESLLRQKDQVVKSLNALGLGLGVDAFNAASRFASIDEDWRSRGVDTSGSTGMAPDFGYSYALSDLPGIKDVVVEMNKLIKRLSSTRKAVQQIRQVITTAQRRLDAIVANVTRITTALNSAVALFSFVGANGLLFVSGSGQSEDFAKAIINSPHHPDYPKNDLFDEIVTNVKGNLGGLSPLDRNLGEQGLFGGAYVIHVQAPNTAENNASLLSLFNNLFTELRTTTVNNAESSVERLHTATDMKKRVESQG